ncbi:unnamed protein product, partial [Didymodactylos carnosus]
MLLRSASEWSAGIKVTDFSIQNAYVQLIDAAKYYIYIENQFFITIDQDPQVKNQIGDALYRRILRAHTTRTNFRVYVVLPLLPGFNVENAVEAVLYFIMRSIAKGDNSLYSRLEKAGVKPDDYITFYGMRGNDILMGRLVTEIIYVHSKLMIVDDCWCICGSANINDRSMLGDRDSEMAIVIQDKQYERGIMNGEPVLCGKFCSSWRKKLFGMLLGIQHENPDNIDMSDPVSDKFYNFFRETAHHNTLIYEEVFLALPSDRVRLITRDKEYLDTPKMADTDPERAYQRLKEIKGLVVEIPLYFRHEENFMPSITTME